MDKTRSRKKDEVSVDVRKRVLRRGAVALIIISSVLTMLAVLGGWLFMAFIGYTRADNEYKTEYIRNDDEFIKLMGARIVSHEYRLLADINIDAEIWNDTMDNIVLRGVLNGNGHKVTIVGQLRIPLFSYIEKNATVNHVAFVNSTLAGSKQTSAATLAYVNYGNVFDCTFSNSKATVGAEQYISFVVAHNFGKIENCIVDGRFFSGDSAVGRFVAGAVSAINYNDAEIKNCIVNVKYTDGFKEIENSYFNENEVNDKIGYVVGQNNGNLNAVYCVNAEHFIYSSDGKSEIGIDSIKTSDLTVKLITSLDFASDYWDIADGQLPVLKIMMGMD